MSIGKVLSTSLVASVALMTSVAEADMAPLSAEMHLAKKAMPNTTIKSAAQSVIKGMVEVVAGNNVMYLDESGRYLVIGSIYDLRTATDLTANRKQEIRDSIRVTWDVIPKNGATFDTGELPEFAVLFDPLCPYCKKLHDTIETMGNLDVKYVYVAEKAGSDEIIADVVCSQNPNKALSDYYQGVKLEKANNACANGVKTGLAENRSFTRKTDLLGTPILIRKDGKTKIGAASAEKLAAWLKETKENIAQVTQ